MRDPLGPLVDTTDHGHTRAREAFCHGARDLLGVRGEPPAANDRDPRTGGGKQLPQTLSSTRRVQHSRRVRELPQRPRIASVVTAQRGRDGVGQHRQLQPAQDPGRILDFGSTQQRLVRERKHREQPLLAQRRAPRERGSGRGKHRGAS